MDACRASLRQLLGRLAIKLCDSSGPKNKLLKIYTFFVCFSSKRFHSIFFLYSCAGAEGGAGSQGPSTVPQLYLWSNVQPPVAGATSSRVDIAAAAPGLLQQQQRRPSLQPPPEHQHGPGAASGYGGGGGGPSRGPGPRRGGREAWEEGSLTEGLGGPWAARPPPHGVPAHRPGGHGGKGGCPAGGGGGAARGRPPPAPPADPRPPFIPYARQGGAAADGSPPMRLPVPSGVQSHYPGPNHTPGSGSVGREGGGPSEDSEEGRHGAARRVPRGEGRRKEDEARQWEHFLREQVWAFTLAPRCVCACPCACLCAFVDVFVNKS